MVVQAKKPVSFDWMVKGICGLNHVKTMMEEVEELQPFGSFFAFTELPDLPYLEVNSSAFLNASKETKGEVSSALAEASKILAQNGEQWSREVEEVLYEGCGEIHPLNLKN
jgi:hypothetical protein